MMLTFEVLKWKQKGCEHWLEIVVKDEEDKRKAIIHITESVGILNVFVYPTADLPRARAKVRRLPKGTKHVHVTLDTNPNG